MLMGDDKGVKQQLPFFAGSRLASDWHECVLTRRRFIGRRSGGLLASAIGLNHRAAKCLPL
jgi:hypothetical protein